MKRLLKFQAEWCGPCHAIAPAVKQAAEQAGLEVEEVDIDKNPDLAELYGVQAIPTILLVEGGQELARHTGSAPKSAILANLGL